MVYAPVSRGVLFPDACTGDLDGDGFEDAVFIVCFPGEGARPPEKRLFFLMSGMEEAFWLRCVDAQGVQVRRGEGGDTLVVDTGAEGLKEVDFRRIGP